MKKIRFTVLICIAFLLIMNTPFDMMAYNQTGSDSASYNCEETNSDDVIGLVEFDYETREERYFELSLEQLKNENLGLMESNKMSAETIDSAYIPEGLQTIDENQPKALLPGKEWNPVSSVNVFPYTAVLAMKMGWENDNKSIDWYYGTGFLEGYDVVATAGHNMWDSELGWVDDCRFFVRQNGTPYSSTDYYHPKNWTCATNYTSNSDSNYDWCAITLWSNLGSANGWFGRGWSQNGIDDKSVTVSGYPGTAGIQYTGSGTTSNSTTYKVYYDINTQPGNSGSPVYTSSYVAWAIHTASYSSTLNRENRITEWLFTILKNKYLEGAAIYGS